MYHTATVLLLVNVWDIALLGLLHDDLGSMYITQQKAPKVMARTGMRSGYFSLMRDASAWRFSVGKQRHQSWIKGSEGGTHATSNLTRLTKRVFLLEALIAHNHGSCFGLYELAGMSRLALST